MFYAEFASISFARFELLVTELVWRVQNKGLIFCMFYLEKLKWQEPSVNVFVHALKHAFRVNF